MGVCALVARMVVILSLASGKRRTMLFTEQFMPCVRGFVLPPTLEDEYRGSGAGISPGRCENPVR